MFMFSEDGKAWMQANDPWSIKWPHTLDMPPRVKVGVVAEATAPGQFEPAFDQFRLTRPPKRVAFDLLLDDALRANEASKRGGLP
jgi:hypothetical protein